MLDHLLQVLDISDNCVSGQDKLEQLEYLAQQLASFGVKVTYWQSNRQPTLPRTWSQGLNPSRFLFLAY